MDNLGRNELLAIKAKQGDQQAMEVLWRRNTRLVFTLVHRYAENRNATWDDMMQSAWFGLLEAVRLFKPGCCAFNTVLGWCVKKTCRIALGIERKRIEADVPLDAPLSEDAGSDTLADMIEDVTLRPAFDLVEEDGMRRDMLEAIGQLTQEEQAVIRARYYSGLTIQRTADALSMPVTKVRLREESALKKLRRNKLLCRWHCPDGVPWV